MKKVTFKSKIGKVVYYEDAYLVDGELSKGLVYVPNGVTAYDSVAMCRQVHVPVGKPDCYVLIHPDAFIQLDDNNIFARELKKKNKKTEKISTSWTTSIVARPR